MIRKSRLLSGYFKYWRFVRGRAWAYIYIAMLIGMFIWLFIADTQGTFISLIYFMVIGGVLIGAAVVTYTAWQKVRHLRFQRKLKHLLAGKSLQEVLDASPYYYGYGDQGDDYLHIWRKDDPASRTDITSFLAPNIGAENAAILWIVEDYEKSKS